MQQGACAGTQEPEAGRENFVNFSSGLEVKFLWKCLQKEEDLLTGTSNQTSHHHLTELLDSSGPEYHWEDMDVASWASIYCPSRVGLQKMVKQLQLGV
ncbi:uncharacterized protein LOC119959604 isoform X4 [Scyliorhinus canicula]|uniref:uncharacterized protein LOC119959604 isoform X4 n=1 Tax=Scyliorhinus canicula TaxID=7830 RepID=UPI0018F5E189|nr:uncharacterized protein LOC119959604 isoform X4 [Scyliorhinus canicula]